MKMTEQLIRVADAYCKAATMKRSRLSTILLGSGTRLDVIAGGRDLQTGTFEAAMQWLSDNWPAKAKWPKDIERPAPRLEAAQ